MVFYMYICNLQQTCLDTHWKTMIIMYASNAISVRLINMYNEFFEGIYKILKKKSFEELNAIGCFKGQEQKMNKNLLKFFFLSI